MAQLIVRNLDEEVVEALKAPDTGDDEDFARQRDLPRDIEL